MSTQIIISRSGADGDDFAFGWPDNPFGFGFLIVDRLGITPNLDKILVAGFNAPPIAGSNFARLDDTVLR
jgi:hypothetical protein